LNPGKKSECSSQAGRGSEVKNGGSSWAEKESVELSGYRRVSKEAIVSFVAGEFSKTEKGRFRIQCGELPLDA
jgi:hypothetical protein